MSKQKRGGPSPKRPERIERVQKIEVNVWGMIQNVLTHAMNKGQLMGVAIAGLLALLIYKTPPELSGLLLHRILDNLTSAKGVSYSLNIALVLGWAFHARWQRRQLADEMDRIGTEKTQLQEKLTEHKLGGSTKKDTQHEH